jgi:hypothetical protein
MTFGVVVRGGRVVESAPIARVFLGQAFGKLLWWMHGQGGLRYSLQEPARPW